MQLRIPAVAAAAIALCSATPPPPPVLGGVDLARPFRASGGGPSWLFEGTGTAFRFNDFLSDDGKPVAVARLAPIAVVRNRATFRGRTARGATVELVLTATPCPDLGEETRRLTAQLRVGAQRYAGCADASSRYN